MGPNNDWNIYSASQNLASVLNDPNKGKQSNFFVRTWGDGFVEKIDIPKSQFLIDINFGHFENYLRKHGRRYKKHTKLKSSDSFIKNVEKVPKKVEFSDTISISEERAFRSSEKVPFDTKRLSRNEFSETQGTFRPNFDGTLFRNIEKVPRKSEISDIKSIPEIFLRPNLPLNDAGTFNAIFPCVNLENGSENNVRGSARLIQERLSHFLDTVEVEIAHQVAQKSGDFFYAMKSHDCIMEQMSVACVNVKKLRQTVKTMDNELSKSSLKLLGLVKSRKNRLKTLEKLKLIATVLQTQPTLQLLLSNSDYVGALELILSTQAVLSRELAGITALRHLPSQLKEMSRLIDKMLNAEFEKYIFADLNRPADRLALIEGDRLTSIIAGLLRQKNLLFLEVYKKEAITSAQATLKQITIEQIADFSEKDLRLTGSADSISLASTLSSEKWLKLIEMSIEALSKLALRVKDTHDCIKDISNLYAGKNRHFDEKVPKISAEKILVEKVPDIKIDEKVPESHLNDEKTNLDHWSKNSTVVEKRSQTAENSLKNAPDGFCDPNFLEKTLLEDDSETFLTSDDLHRIETKLKDLLTTISDYFHDRIAKMILDVSPNQQNSKNEVAKLQNLIENFSELLSKICGRKSSALTIAFNTQASKYVSNFHGSRKAKLILLLDAERWRAAEIPSNFQRLVEKFLENDRNFSEIDIEQNGQIVEFLEINGQKFITVGAVLMLLRLISDYCILCYEVPSQSLNIARFLSEILKTFNSRTCQLILGAKALQTAGLKTITTTNLALASRSLQLVQTLIPNLRKYFNFNDIPGLDLVEKDISHHVFELEAKILNILSILLSEQLTEWNAKPPVPSVAFRNISKHLVKLHEAVNKILPPEQINEIYTIIHKNFKEKLRDQISKMNITNDGGPKHGAVTSELMFYVETLKKLNVIPNEIQNMDDIWTKKA